MLETTIFLLDGPRVGSPAFFSSCGVMKVPVDPLSKIPIVVRAWSRRPMILGVSYLSNVCTVVMGYFKYTPRSLEWLVVVLRGTGVVVSCRR